MTIDPTPDETEYPDPYRDCRPLKKDEPTDTEIKVWETIGLLFGDHYSPKRFSNSANIEEDLHIDEGDRNDLLIGLGLEDDFAIDITDEEYEEFYKAETVQDLINLVDSKL